MKWNTKAECEIRKWQLNLENTALLCPSVWRHHRAVVRPALSHCCSLIIAQFKSRAKQLSNQSVLWHSNQLTYKPIFHNHKKKRTKNLHHVYFHMILWVLRVSRSLSFSHFHSGPVWIGVNRTQELCPAHGSPLRESLSSRDR